MIKAFIQNGILNDLDRIDTHGLLKTGLNYGFILALITLLLGFGQQYFLAKPNNDDSINQATQQSLAQPRKSNDEIQVSNPSVDNLPTHRVTVKKVSDSRFKADQCKDSVSNKETSAGDITNSTVEICQ